MRDLGPRQVDSYDILSDKDDSSFGQQTPIITKFGIQVRPLEHEYNLPYDDNAFDIVLSVGVLEHVPNDVASMAEIRRVLKPGGLFFPASFFQLNLLWTQKVAHLRGNNYHDSPLFAKQSAENACNNWVSASRPLVPTDPAQEYRALSEVPPIRKGRSVHHGAHALALSRNQYRVRLCQTEGVNPAAFGHSALWHCAVIVLQN